MPPNRFSHRGRQRRDLLEAADVDLRRHDVGVAAFGHRRQFCGGLRQPLGADIGNANFHAEAGEPHRGGKPDAGGASGDHGDIIGGHGGMGHGGLPLGHKSG